MLVMVMVTSMGLQKNFQGQVKVSRVNKIQLTRINWKIKSIFYGLATRTLYFLKKYDTKWPKFPPCRNWPICMWLQWLHFVLFCEANFIIRLLFPVDSTSCCVVSTCWPFGYNCFLLILDGTRPSVCILSIMSQVNNQSANPSVVILLIHYTGIVAANTWPSWPLKQTKRPARGGGLCKTKLAIENKKHGL